MGVGSAGMAFVLMCGFVWCGVVWGVVRRKEHVFLETGCKKLLPEPRRKQLSQEYRPDLSKAVPANLFSAIPAESSKLL